MKRYWQAGRKSICGQDKAVTITLRICPAVRKLLMEYCKENNALRSVIVNNAIRDYIEKNKDVENVGIQGKENGGRN